MTNQQVVQIPPAIVVGELAELLGVSGIDVIKELMKNGVMATITQTIDFDTAAVVAADLGFEPEEQNNEADDLASDDPDAVPALRTLRIVEEGEGQIVRSPVVTVLGHVDHGKTTLLDRIRETNVVDGEAGGITQHIGAYQAKAPDGRTITFIDTPGHEAFSKMRARGAMVTDVAIIVVAADDGVMPQTREAIDHVKAAGVPMVIAINKIDAGNANPDRVVQQLTEVGLVPEAYGGDQLVVQVSALKGEGIADLLESVQLLTDIAELTANPDQDAIGVVLEAETDRHRGVVATVLVQTGTLRQGDTILAGRSYGRVKAMTLATGERVQEAGPSTPVEILGLSDVPPAGERFVMTKNEKEARAQSVGRQRALDAGAIDRSGVTLDSLFGEIHQGNVKDFNLILKTDVQGSIEPLVQSLEELTVEEVNGKVIHASVGSVTESDVQLAVASAGVIIAFNVQTEPGAERLAKQEAVEIREYQIIYAILEDVEKAVKGMLAPVYREVQDATIEVRQVFRLGRRNAIAGAYVREGTAIRNATCRVTRGGEVIHEGRLESLKRIDEDSREVAAGLECGIMVTNFTDFEEGDVIITHHQEQVR